MTWVQSAVRDPQLREILYDLGKSKDQAEADEDAVSLLRLSKCYHNLLHYAVDL